jgi:hypothetical protein
VLAGRAFELGEMEHSHADGSWHAMEQVASEPAVEDPERGWIRGVIYKCQTCEEQIRVISPVGPESPTEPLTEPEGGA